MAKLERVINADFDVVLNKIEEEIIDRSVSANLEDSSDFVIENTRCSVRVFERYSYMGNQRLSLNITILQVNDGPLNISCISAGGSNAMFIKINKIGENAFLNKIEEILDEIERKYSK